MGKTALQTLIEAWEREYNSIDGSSNYTAYNNKMELKLKLHQAKAMLKVERQQIEEAYNNGFCRSNTNAEDYYQSKYTKGG